MVVELQRITAEIRLRISAARPGQFKLEKLAFAGLGQKPGLDFFA